MQTFFLAPQELGFYVRNDLLRIMPPAVPASPAGDCSDLSSLLCHVPSGMQLLLALTIVTSLSA